MRRQSGAFVDLRVGWHLLESPKAFLKERDQSRTMMLCVEHVGAAAVARIGDAGSLSTQYKGGGTRWLTFALMKGVRSMIY